MSVEVFKRLSMSTSDMATLEELIWEVDSGKNRKASRALSDGREINVYKMGPENPVIRVDLKRVKKI